MTRKYPATTHCTCGRPDPKSRPTVGNAVLTMPASSVDMNVPSTETLKARQSPEPDSRPLFRIQLLAHLRNGLTIAFDSFNQAF